MGWETAAAETVYEWGPVSANSQCECWAQYKTTSEYVMAHLVDRILKTQSLYSGADPDNFEPGALIVNV